MDDLSISLIVPTFDSKRPLADVIKSFLSQKLVDGDELLIGIDCHSTPLNDNVKKLERIEHIKKIETTILSFNSPLIKYYKFDTGHNCWGHCIINSLILNAKGNFLMFMDDDDMLLPESFSKIREVLKSTYAPLHCSCCGHKMPMVKAPILFKVFSPKNEANKTSAYWWRTRDVVNGGVGGHNLITPNIPDRLGRFTCIYPGDAAFVTETLNKWGGAVEWREEVILNIRVWKDSKPIG